MEEIKVGEYVRTPQQGFIGKLVEVNKNVLNYYKIDVGREIRRINGMSDNYIYLRDGFGLKHSSNIIDLIEIGDFVNGRLVLQVDYKNKNVCLLIPLTDTKANTNIMWYGYEDIKTVVTKEQFANAEYRLEE